jgi:hypothetical protein
MMCFQRRWTLTATASLAMLAASAALAPAQQPRSYRSVNDARQRIPDELDRPFWRETQSHLGWEIREDHFTVFADMSQGDARWAAEQVKEAWASAAGMADRWTKRHREEDFGLHSTQIVIDSQPLRERDGPLTSVNFVGIQTQIYLNIAPGQPSLKEQTLRLRSAAALAMLHTCGLDSAAPRWVVEGMAAVVAEQGLDPAHVAALHGRKLPARFGGQQWRYKRSRPDELDYPPLDEGAASLSVRFLLEGDDAEHAPAFLAAIEAACRDAEAAAARGRNFRIQPGDSQLPATDTAFDRLLADLQPQFEAWKRDPLAAQPLFEPEDSLEPELLAAEREMLVLLKLHRKLAIQARPGRVSPRVAIFDKQQNRQVVLQSGSPNVPATVDALYQRLTDPNAKASATLDVDGRLLLSTDRDRIDELFALHEQRYLSAQYGNQWILVRRLAGHQTLQGWLEVNPENPARPLAKFELVDGRTRMRTGGPPGIESAANAGREFIR